MNDENERVIPFRASFNGGAVSRSEEEGENPNEQEQRRAAVAAYAKREPRRINEHIFLSHKPDGEFAFAFKEKIGSRFIDFKQDFVVTPI